MHYWWVTTSAECAVKYNLRDYYRYIILLIGQLVELKSITNGAYYVLLLLLLLLIILLLLFLLLLLLLQLIGTENRINNPAGYRYTYNLILI